MQILVADVLRLYEKTRHFIWWSTPNELLGSARGNGGIRRMARFKRMGLRPGAADFTIIRDALGYFLELKIKGGKQSDNQKEFQSDALRAGAEYEVAYSFEEAMDWLKYWEIIPNR
jgi:hypothetical protein